MASLLKINYKSGNSITRWFEKFECREVSGVISSITWTLCDKEQPITYMGINDIESIEALLVDEGQEVVL